MPKQIKKFIFLFLIFSFFQILKAENKRNIVFLVHPYLPKAEIVERFNPLKIFIEKKLNVKVSLTVSNNYEEHIFTVGKQDFDIAFIGPAEFLIASYNFSKPEVLGQLEINNSVYFKTVIFGRIACNFSLKDNLTTKKMAFVSPFSTAGYLIPYFYLTKEGRFITRYNFLKNHENVVFGVLSGDFDIGCVKGEVFEKYKNKGLKSLFIYNKTPEHVFVCSNKLPEKLKQKLKSLFMQLNLSKNKQILKSIKSTITGIKAYDEKNMKDLTEILVNINKIKRKKSD